MLSAILLNVIQLTVILMNAIYLNGELHCDIAYRALYHSVECQYYECHSAECHSDEFIMFSNILRSVIFYECHSTECHSVESYSGEFILLNVILMSDILPNGIWLIGECHSAEC